jgi:hypothetical protein
MREIVCPAPGSFVADGGKSLRAILSQRRRQDGGCRQGATKNTFGKHKSCIHELAHAVYADITVLGPSSFFIPLVPCCLQGFCVHIRRMESVHSNIDHHPFLTHVWQCTHLATPLFITPCLPHQPCMQACYPRTLSFFSIFVPRRAFLMLHLSRLVMRHVSISHQRVRVSDTRTHNTQKHTQTHTHTHTHTHRVQTYLTSDFRIFNNTQTIS